MVGVGRRKKISLRQADVILCGPMNANVITLGLQLTWSGEHDTYVAISDDFCYELYSWIPQYVNKIREDLIVIGAWDRSRHHRCCSCR